MLCTGAIHTPRPSTIQPLFARATLPTANGDFDWFKACPADGDALGNRDVGDCVPCADYRYIETVLANTSGGDAWKPTAAMTLGRYTRMTGFDAATGQPDIGTDTTADLVDWCGNGIECGGGIWRRIQPLWAHLDGASEDARRAAGRALGPQLWTFRLPQNWADIESDPAAWLKAPGPPSDEGHRVLAGATDGETWIVRTWGMDVPVGPAFVAACLVACDVLLTRDWAGTGTAPSGIQWDALRDDLAKSAKE